MNRKTQWLAAVLMAGSLGAGAVQAAPECDRVGPWLGGAAINAYSFRNDCASRACTLQRGYRFNGFRRGLGWFGGGRRVMIVQQPRIVSRTIVTGQPEIVAERLEPVQEIVSVNRCSYRYLGFHRLSRASNCCAPSRGMEAVMVTGTRLAPVGERIISRTTAIEEVAPAYTNSDTDYMSCP